MTAREKILAAFSQQGTTEIAAVISYEMIFVRDHWFGLTEVPWWYQGSGIVEQEIAWMRDVTEKTGLEWQNQVSCFSRAEHERHRYEDRRGKVWRVDELTGEETELLVPIPSGANTVLAADSHFDLDNLPSSKEQIDAAITLRESINPETFLQEGRNEVNQAAQRTLGLFTYSLATSPLSDLYYWLGYEGMMMLIGSAPELARHAARRYLENEKTYLRELAALGVDAVWIEEFFTDQISPETFQELNVPLMKEYVEAIRASGLKSIYYYCGNPMDRLEPLLAVGADAVHFEESKKNFVIDIDHVVAAVEGRCTVFGNVDSIGILQNGSDDDLCAEIERQLRAGWRNRGRFIVSSGSPVTPATSVERLRRYTNTVRVMGRTS
jgi:hypothetical protein